MGITTKKQTLSIVYVRDVQVTEAVDDGEGGFVRAIRITADTTDAGDPAQVFELLIGSDVETDLDLTTPALTY